MSDGATFDPEPWRGELQAYLRRMGAGHDAEDLVQETFLRSVQRPPAGAPRPWLYGIALNLLRDRRRTEQRAREARPHVEDAEADARRSAAADPAHATERDDLAQRAWTLVERLPRRQQTALLLRIRAHLDYAAVAAALECSEATARQHVYLGLKAVRDALAGAHGDGP